MEIPETHKAYMRLDNSSLILIPKPYVEVAEETRQKSSIDPKKRLKDFEQYENKLPDLEYSKESGVKVSALRLMEFLKLLTKDDDIFIETKKDYPLRIKVDKKDFIFILAPKIET